MARIAALIVLGMSAGGVLADAESNFEMLFGAEAKKVRATPGTADDAAFAAKLLSAAKSLGDSPQLRLLVYEKACAFGMRNPQGHAVALKAIDLAESATPGKSAKFRARRLELMKFQFDSGRGAAKKRAAKSYLEMLLTMAAAEISHGNTAADNGQYVQAFRVATYLRSPLAGGIAAKRRAMAQELAATKKRQVRLKALQAKLRENPKDAAARRGLILLHLVEQDKPQEAAKLVSDDLDESLRTYVPLAAMPVANVAEVACLELGVWYRQLAAKAPPEGKAAALRRAAVYYRRYLAVHTKKDAQSLNARMALAMVEKSARDGRAVYLSDLKPASVRTFRDGTWGFGTNGDLGAGKKRITVDGVASPKGLGTHAISNGSCHIVYPIKRTYRVFRGRVAINDSSRGALSPITFRIVGDRKLLWRSSPVRKPRKPQSFRVSVAGVSTLELLVDCPGHLDGAHAAWIEPQLLQ